jgi:hypothetical protein
MPIINRFKDGEFEEAPIPTTLEEAFDVLDEIIFPDERDLVLEYSEEMWRAQSYRMGGWLRNTWKFWEKEGPLYEWFVDYGITHADDMSGIVLLSYWRHKNGKSQDVEGQVQHYLDYWDKREFERI